LTNLVVLSSNDYNSILLYETFELDQLIYCAYYKCVVLLIYHSHLHKLYESEMNAFTVICTQNYTSGAFAMKSRATKSPTRARINIEILIVALLWLRGKISIVRICNRCRNWDNGYANISGHGVPIRINCFAS